MRIYVLLLCEVFRDVLFFRFTTSIWIICRYVGTFSRASWRLHVHIISLCIVSFWAHVLSNALRCRLNIVLNNFQHTIALSRVNLWMNTHKSAHEIRCCGHCSMLISSLLAVPSLSIISTAQFCETSRKCFMYLSGSWAKSTFQVNAKHEQEKNLYFFLPPIDIFCALRHKLSVTEC